MLSKSKKIILGVVGIGVLTAGIVTPITLLNQDDDENKNQKDVEAVAKILKDKTSEERIIKLASDSSGKIIGNNKEKIIAEIKKLITDSKLRGVTIEVSMENDVDISTNAFSITVTLKKGEHSIKIFNNENEGIKIKRDFSTIESEANKSIENIKTILDGKTSKLVTIVTDEDERIDEDEGIIKKIQFEIRWRVLKRNLDGVKITVSKDETNGIINLNNGIGFKMTISKPNGKSLTITDWKVKRENSNLTYGPPTLDQLTQGIV